MVRNRIHDPSASWHYPLSVAEDVDPDRGVSMVTELVESHNSDSLLAPLGTEQILAMGGAIEPGIDCGPWGTKTPAREVQVLTE